MAELASPGHGCHVHTESCARTSDSPGRATLPERPKGLEFPRGWPSAACSAGNPLCFDGLILQEAQESMESPNFSEASCLSSLLSLIAPGANNNKKIEIFHLLVPGNRNHPSLCVGVWGQPDQLHKDSLIYSPEQSWSNSTGRERKQPADTGNCQEQPNLSGLNPSFSNPQMLRSTSLCTALTSTIIQISLFSPKLEGNG